MSERHCIGSNPLQAGNPFGLWIARPGKNYGSSDPDDYLFSPDSYLSIPYMKGTVTALRTYGLGVIRYQGSLASGRKFYYSFSKVIYHGLGFVPIFYTIAGDFNDSYCDDNFLYMLTQFIQTIV